ncbi:MAG: polyprenyl synthetase family protein [Flavobacteriales bacterium]|nr:polyprenyl synthetase family protein [Flavobacteriales bacterium]
MSNLKSIADLQDALCLALENKNFPSEPKNLYEPISYILSLGGKRLRPVMVLMVADMYGCDITQVMPQAIGVEYFHNFTLLHDDIMDDAPLRRGMTTVHEKWNANVGILSGDALFVKAYQSLVKTDTIHLPDLIDLFNQTALEVCEGQQYDMDFETQDLVSMDAYLRMIKYKTAVLLACSLKMGAIVSRASIEDQNHLYDFGIHTGIAFQLMDDLLDVYGNQKDFGKQIAGDILCNKKTCLYIRAYEVADASQRKVLDHYFAHQDFDPEEKIAEVKKVYELLNVKAYCLQSMEEHYKLAMSHMAQISIPQDRKSTMTEFVDMLMVRIQ